MKILGIGVDIIKNSRVKSLIRNKDFIKRTFGKKEIKTSSKLVSKTNFFAKRFAAKESLAKALGTGFRKNLNFKDIEVLNDKIGKPYYKKNKKIAEMVKKNFKVKNFNFFLSISDEKDYSTAFAIIQSI